MVDAENTPQVEESQTSGGEFEREPVPKRSLLGLKSFVGMYAGEHCAGTELMIGPLFVMAGVSAYDLVIGLLLGNLLAVLSWMVVTAPIATRARLTMYFQLEKICGRKLVILYNLANGVMFCFLAGAMITVSATAVGRWFNVEMPTYEDLYPNSTSWILAALAVGALISIVAAFGYRMVSHFANIASPWMVLIFLAFGMVGLKDFLAANPDVEINGLKDLWGFVESHIWKGGDPYPGKIKFTLWHVTFFAWFCNIAMHLGMADLTIFRFAKKSWYAIATSTGMYIGHFMAWMSAAILFALQVPADRSADLPTPLPGALADNACGIAGLICVIVAGWTTANPTIYRAGLAFQAIVPKSPRFLITLLAGAIATTAGLFPFLAMKLLGFVAVYGLLIMPMGAVIFMDFWVVKRMGLQSNYAEKSGKSFNWAAGIAWILTLLICFVLVKFGDLKAYVAETIPALKETVEGIEFNGIEIFFVSLPGWFLAATLFVLVSFFYQRKITKQTL